MSALPVRSACERGVRLVRDHALGYLKLSEGKVPKVGAKKRLGGQDAVTDAPSKDLSVDEERLKQIRESFRQRNGSDSQSESGH